MNPIISILMEEKLVFPRKNRMSLAYKEYLVANL